MGKIEEMVSLRGGVGARRAKEGNGIRRKEHRKRIEGKKLARKRELSISSRSKNSNSGGKNETRVSWGL